RGLRPPALRRSRADPPRRPHPRDGRAVRLQDGDDPHDRGEPGAPEAQRARPRRPGHGPHAPGQQAHQRVLPEGARPPRREGAAHHPEVRQHHRGYPPAPLGRVRPRGPAAPGRPGAPRGLRRGDELGRDPREGMTTMASRAATRRRWRMATAAVTLSFAVAVAAAAQEPPLRVGGVTARPGEKASGWLEVPDGIDSGARLPVSVVHGARPGPVLALVAGTHGYEYTSIVALP